MRQSQNSRMLNEMEKIINIHRSLIKFEFQKDNYSSGSTSNQSFSLNHQSDSNNPTVVHLFWNNDDFLPVYGLIVTKKAKIVIGRFSGNVEIYVKTQNQYQLENKFKAHQYRITGIAEGYNHNIIITTSVDCSAKLWNIENCQLLSTFIGHSGFVYSPILLSNHSQICTCSSDNTIKVWNIDGSCLYTLTGHTNIVKSVLELKDGCLVSGGWNDTIRIWKKRKYGYINTSIYSGICCYSSYSSICYLQQDNKLVVGGKGEIYIIDLNEEIIVSHIKDIFEINDGIYSITHLNDGSFLVSSKGLFETDCKFIKFNQDFKFESQLNSDNDHCIYYCRKLFNCNMFITSDNKGLISIWKY